MDVFDQYGQNDPIYDWREHELKVWGDFFEPLWSGDKRFELRKDDRGYKVGDTLMLREWSKQNGYSGRWIRTEVTYILNGLPWLQTGYVCMSINEIERSHA